MMGKTYHRLEIPPRVKPRPRVTRNGTHMPKPYMKWREDVQALLHGQGAILHDVPLSLEVAFSRTEIEIWYQVLGTRSNNRQGMATGDIDNLLGGVMDAAQGVLWVDDRSIHQVEGRLEQ